MQIINLEHNKWPKLGAITLAIGNFDGFHQGHQRLVKKVLSYKDTKSAILTLNPHPAKLFGNGSFQTLFTIENKVDLIKKSNIDYMFIANFNEQFAKLSVRAFIKNLKRLGVIRIIVGKDFRFAHKGKGTLLDLQKAFLADVLDDIETDHTRISTTKIKAMITSGNITKANEMLGYQYFIDGEVVHGDKVGRTLSYPTANINYKDAILPKKGIYFVSVRLNNNENYYGMCNIGNNPTINYSETIRLEVYIFDYNNQIYDQSIRLYFIERLRDEIKFANKEDLIKQIKKDEENSRLMIKMLNS